MDQATGGMSYRPNPCELRRAGAVRSSPRATKRPARYEVESIALGGTG